MGTTTLLQAVNKGLRRGRLIQGADGELTSLVNSQYQNDVTLMVNAWNDVVRYMYNLGDDRNPLPEEASEGSVTFVAGQREYATPTDFVGIANDVMVQQTDGYYITRLEGGYRALFETQLQPSTYEGRPTMWVINPVTSAFYFDYIPTADDAGDVYVFLYNKTLEFDSAADTFPFTDEVLLELVPAVTEWWQRETKERFDQQVFQTSISSAIKKLRMVPIRTSY